MKNFSYISQFLLLFVWVFVVGALFTLIPTKPLAGVIAGIGFIGIGSFLFLSELKKDIPNRLQILSVGAFLLFSAIPIFLLRVTNWGVEFKELSLLGISSDLLHRFSNFLYLIMVLTTLLGIYKEKKKKF